MITQILALNLSREEVISSAKNIWKTESGTPVIWEDVLLRVTPEIIHLKITWKVKSPKRIPVNISTRNFWD